MPPLHMLCICLFVLLYLRVRHMGISFGIFLNNTLSKNMAHVGSFWHFVICCICVFVYLYFCICMFDTWEYHFWYPWTMLFSKICHMLGLSGTSLYAVFVCLCLRQSWYPWFKSCLKMYGLYDLKHHTGRLSFAVDMNRKAIIGHQVHLHFAHMWLIWSLLKYTSWLWLHCTIPTPRTRFGSIRSEVLEKTFPRRTKFSIGN